MQAAIWPRFSSALRAQRSSTSRDPVRLSTRTGKDAADLLRQGRFTPGSLLQAGLNIRNLLLLLTNIAFKGFNRQENFDAVSRLNQLR
jgi:hypothetical protein